MASLLNAAPAILVHPVFANEKAWIFVDEPPHRQSWCSTIWGFIVWMASGYHPITFSYQNSLPRLPVPPLNCTIDKFLDSVKPLYAENSEEFQILKKDAEVRGQFYLVNIHKVWCWIFSNLRLISVELFPLLTNGIWSYPIIGFLRALQYDCSYLFIK